MKPAIIIPAYSRHNSLDRLLTSINKAEYPSNDIKLIITLDGGGTGEVEKVADSFVFNSGSVKVIKRKENLGLRKHILWCGDQTKKYGSIIVLEDDLFVDRYYYHYASQAIKFYKKCKKIAGIALYSQKYNGYANLPFEPLYNGRSNYFMQVACSWGQAWTYRQWHDFRSWYEKVDQRALRYINNLPDKVKNWPESSWKKYFSAYLAKENKYFVYPYTSCVTNCSEPGGTHVKEGSNKHHVPLPSTKRPLPDLNFCKFEDSSVCYDSFMESESDEIFENIGISKNEVGIDVYGLKPIELLERKKYVLTSKKVKNPIKEFELDFKPIEKSVLYAVKDYENKFFNKKRDGNISLIKSSKLRHQYKSNGYYQLGKYFSYFVFLNKEFAKNFIIDFIKSNLKKFIDLKL